ncbi:MAG: helix-turn-helix domain-containing protein [Corallococcus sp.]|nr:helix-turn-helix domain-containing protein [Corallococcus sp.]MCM1359091.1 helix-turn-helix domain-containing protein [Corallococcus sp.]MCM1395080.1 helix-turn-helix domain-containing protein [Corallococcus sp.]
MTLKELRERKFANLSEFAAAMDTSKATVCQWETGKRVPNVKQIVRLERVLDVSRYELLDVFANKNGQL